MQPWMQQLIGCRKMQASQLTVYLATGHTTQQIATKSEHANQQQKLKTEPDWNEQTVRNQKMKARKLVDYLATQQANRLHN